MEIHSMHFTLQVMDKVEPARKYIIKNMVDETLERSKARTISNDARDNTFSGLMTGKGNGMIGYEDERSINVVEKDGMVGHCRQIGDEEIDSTRPSRCAHTY